MTRRVQTSKDNPVGSKDMKILGFPIGSKPGALTVAVLGAVLISVFALTSIARFFLNQSAQQLATNFELQNLSELSSGDAYNIAAKLTAFSSGFRWQCIIASLNCGHEAGGRELYSVRANGPAVAGSFLTIASSSFGVK